jgi:hypothetical protein
MNTIVTWLDQLDSVLFRAFKLLSLLNGIAGLLSIEIWGLLKLWHVIAKP